MLLTPANGLHNHLAAGNHSKLPRKLIAGEVAYSRIPVEYW
jgi:hypothetical protein